MINSPKRKMKKILMLSIVFLVFIISLPIIKADEIIINSKDWKDVYAGTQYGFLTGIQPKFLASEKHGALLMNEMQKENNKIEVFSSQKNSFVFGYGPTLKQAGFDVTETQFKTLTLDLAKKLTDINNYIIIDDSYGYNAIAVAPYAIISKSYVLFADSNNIGEIASFLNSKQIDKILIYGHVDREVRDRLSQFKPEIINKDGDRFANNVEIVKKYKGISNTKQVLLSNGEFIENEIMSGAQPVLFVGRDNVPDKIRDYIKNSDIEVGVLIGNELVGTATVVRRQTGISTFVKFARSARTTEGPIAQVEGLDIFRLPKIEINLAIDSMIYNVLTKQLEVTVKNNGEVAAYFKGTYSVTSGDSQQTIGDIEPIFIDGNDVKTIVYSIDPIPGEDDITAKAFVVFGESKDSLEFALEQTLTVKRVEVQDDTAITIEKVDYEKNNDRFKVYIKNIGNVNAFADPEIVDILVLDERQTFAAEKTIEIPVGKTRPAVIKVSLTDEDLLNNPKIKVRTYYGQRENALIKIIEGDFAVKIISSDIFTYMPLIIIVILLILIFLARRKKKKSS